ncbi:hypothetical protein GW932_02990 [archaeon]|nr:hypothetical protein [archaeon]
MTQFLKPIITLIPTVIKLFKKQTPKVGNKIANAGIKLLTGGLAATGSASLIDASSLDNITALVVAITQMLGALSALVGTIAIAVGKSQIKENPDVVINGGNSDGN